MPNGYIKSETGTPIELVDATARTKMHEHSNKTILDSIPVNAEFTDTQADWDATSGKAAILNKPTLFSGNYNDLSNKPTIPAAVTDEHINGLISTAATGYDKIQIVDIRTECADIMTEYGAISFAQFKNKYCPDSGDWTKMFNITSGSIACYTEEHSDGELHSRFDVDGLVVINNYDYVFWVGTAILLSEYDYDTDVFETNSSFEGFATYEEVSTYFMYKPFNSDATPITPTNGQVLIADSSAATGVNWADTHSHSNKTILDAIPANAEFTDTQADWNATSGKAVILNKPDLVTDDHINDLIDAKIGTLDTYATSILEAIG